MNGDVSNFQNFLIIILFLSVALLYIITVPNKVRVSVFGPKPMSRELALETGYGYYSDPQVLDCQTEDGSCETPGSKISIKRCIPNPNTGKGCIKENGDLTYNMIIEEQTCNIQCFQSEFARQTAIEVKKNSQGDFVLEGSGCNTILDKRTGLDVTNNFLGDYIQSEAKYKLKSCVPDNDKYIGYYEIKWPCTASSETGIAGCNFQCGSVNPIKSFGGTLEGSGENETLSLYPYYSDSEGNRQYYCFDKNGTNQVELFNSEIDVNTDFVYPDKCYKITNRFEFDQNLYYPATHTNVINTNGKYTNKYNYYYFSFYASQIPMIEKIINMNYNIYNDYNNYIVLEINKELQLLQNFINNFSNDSLNKTNGVLKVDGFSIAYLPVLRSEISNSNIEKIKYSLYFSFISPTGLSYKTVQTTASIGTTEEYLEYIIDNSTVKDYIFLPFQFIRNGAIAGLFENPHLNTSYIFKNDRFYIDHSDLEEGDYIYYKNSITISNPLGLLSKIELDGDDKYFSSIIIPNELTGNILFWKLHVPEHILFSGTGDTTYTFLPDLIFVTENIALKDFNKSIDNSPIKYSYLRKTDPEDINDKEFYAYGTGSEIQPEGGIPSIIDKTGFYYPLLLTKTATYNKGVNLDEFPSITFYTPEPASDIDFPNRILVDHSLENIIDFNDYYGFANISFKTGSLVLPDRILNFFREADVVSPGSDYTNDKNYQLFFELDNLLVKTSEISDGEFYILKTVRSNNNIFKTFTNTPQNHEVENKLSDYFDIIKTQINFSELTGSINYDIIFNFQKLLTTDLDLTVFKTPYYIDTENKVNYFCFDEDGNPSDPEKIEAIDLNVTVYAYIPCDNYNAENSKCGIPLLKEGNPCVQERNPTTFVPSETCKSDNSNKNYQTVDNIFEDGYEIGKDVQLYCLKEYNKAIDPDNTENDPNIAKECYKTFITGPIDKRRIYDTSEEAFSEIPLRELYFSNIDDNTNIPFSRDGWTNINNDLSTEINNFGENILLINNGFYYFLLTNNEGLNIANSNVIFNDFWKKNVSTYRTFSNLASTQQIFRVMTDNQDFNLLENVFNSNFYGGQLTPYSIRNEVPNNIKITLLDSNMSENQIDYNFTVSYYDPNISSSDIVAGDFFVPDMNIFTPIWWAMNRKLFNFFDQDPYDTYKILNKMNIISLNTQDKVDKFIGLGTQPGKTFELSPALIVTDGDYPFEPIDLTGYYALLIPYLDSGRGDLQVRQSENRYLDILIEFLVYYNNRRGLDNLYRKYLPQFEMVLVEGLEEKFITLKRNILGIDKENIFSPNGVLQNGIEPEENLVLVFPITKERIFDNLYQIKTIDNDNNFLTFDIKINFPFELRDSISTENNYGIPRSINTVNFTLNRFNVDLDNQESPAGFVGMDNFTPLTHKHDGDGNWVIGGYVIKNGEKIPALYYTTNITSSSPDQWIRCDFPNSFKYVFSGRDIHQDNLGWKYITSVEYGHYYETDSKDRGKKKNIWVATGFAPTINLVTGFPLNTLYPLVVYSDDGIKWTAGSGAPQGKSTAGMQGAFVKHAHGLWTWGGVGKFNENGDESFRFTNNPKTYFWNEQNDAKLYDACLSATNVSPLDDDDMTYLHDGGTYQNTGGWSIVGHGEGTQIGFYIRNITYRRGHLGSFVNFGPVEKIESDRWESLYGKHCMATSIISIPYGKLTGFHIITVVPVEDLHYLQSSILNQYWKANLNWHSITFCQYFTNESYGGLIVGDPGILYGSNFTQTKPLPDIPGASGSVVYRGFQSSKMPLFGAVDNDGSYSGLLPCDQLNCWSSISSFNFINDFLTYIPADGVVNPIEYPFDGQIVISGVQIGLSDYPVTGQSPKNINPLFPAWPEKQESKKGSFAMTLTNFISWIIKTGKFPAPPKAKFIWNNYLIKTNDGDKIKGSEIFNYITRKISIYEKKDIIKRAIAIACGPYESSFLTNDVVVYNAGEPLLINDTISNLGLLTIGSTSKYIKKEISPPNVKVDNGTTLVLVNQLNTSKTDSMVQELMIIENPENDNSISVYINEVRIEGEELAFNIGNIIKITGNNNLTFNFLIMQRNVLAPNPGSGLVFDYLCNLRGDNDVIASFMASIDGTGNKLLPDLYIYKKSQNKQFFDWDEKTYDYFIPYVTLVTIVVQGYHFAFPPQHAGQFVKKIKKENEQWTVVAYLDGNFYSVETLLADGDMTLFPYNILYNDAKAFTDNLQINTGYLDRAITYQLAMDRGELSIISLKELQLLNSNITLTDIKTNGVPSGSYHFSEFPTTAKFSEDYGQSVWTDLNTGKGKIISFFIPSDTYLITDTIYQTTAGFEFKVISQDIGFLTLANKSNSRDIEEFLLDGSYNKNDLVSFLNDKNRVYFRNNTGESTYFDSNKWTVVPFSSYPEANYSVYNNEYIYIKDSIVRFENKLWKALKNINPGPNTENPDLSDDWNLVINDLVLESYTNDFYTLSGQITSDVDEKVHAPPIRVTNINGELIFHRILDDRTKYERIIGNISLHFNTRYTFELNNTNFHLSSSIIDFTSNILKNNYNKLENNHILHIKYILANKLTTYEKFIESTNLYRSRKIQIYIQRDFDDMFSTFEKYNQVTKIYYGTTNNLVMGEIKITAVSVEKLIIESSSVNNQNLPIQVKNFDESLGYCSNTCVKAPNTDGYTYPDFLDLYTTINSKFFNNNIKIGTTEGRSSILSLSNTPCSEVSSIPVRYLADCSANGFLNPSFAQYVYQIPMLSEVEMGKPNCIGTDPFDKDFSKLIYSNSLLMWFIPLDLESQDFIKYAYNNTYNNTILSSIRDGEFWYNLPKYDGETVTLSNSIKDGSTNTDITIAEFNTRIISQEFATLDIDQTFILKSEDGTKQCKLTINEKSYSLPFTITGSNFTLGDIWYLKNNNTGVIETHGYIFPKSDLDNTITTESLIILKRINEQIINECTLTILAPSQDYEIKNMDSRPIILDYTLGEAEDLPPGDSILYYNINGQDSLEVQVYVQSDGVILQQSERIIDPSITGEGFIYQRNNTTRLKAKITGNFGIEFISRFKYYPPVKVQSLDGNKYPGLIFDNYYNSLLSEGNSIDVLTGNIVETFPDPLDVFIIDDSDNIRCNMYDKPLNLSKETQIFPDSFISSNSNELSPLSIISSTTTTDIFGITLDNFSFGTVGKYDKVFTGFQIPELGISDNDDLNNVEIRQNRSTTYVDPTNNCNIFFDPIPFVTEPDTISGGIFKFTIKNGNFEIDSETISGNLIIKTNILYSIDQDDNSNFNYPVNLGLDGKFPNKSESVPQKIENSDGSQYITIYYILDGEFSTYLQYNNLELFNKATSRSINILYTTSFTLSNLDDLEFKDLYYGTVNSQEGKFSFSPNSS